MALDMEKLYSMLPPDSRTPAEVEVKAGVIGKGKANMAVSRAIPLSLLAGMFIGLGGLFMLLVKADTTLSFAPSQLLGGLCFALGLLCVIVAGAELFTGNNLMVIGALDGVYTWGQVFKSWAVVWLGNFAGSIILALVIFGAGTASMNGGAMGNAMITTACSKISLSWSAILFRGILCNFLVCVAVWMGFAGRTVIDKVFTTIFPVFAFVACGFEHCVANMFFLPMGYIMKVSGFAYTGSANLDVLTIGGIFYNIGWATLGNIIGGAVFIGCLYWLAYRVKKEAPAAK